MSIGYCYKTKTSTFVESQNKKVFIKVLSIFLSPAQLSNSLYLNLQKEVDRSLKKIFTLLKTA
jgi:hypothetical protein